VENPFDTFFLACRLKDRAAARLAVDNTLRKNLRIEKHRPPTTELDQIDLDNFQKLVRVISLPQDQTLIGCGKIDHHLVLQNFTQTILLDEGYGGSYYCHDSAKTNCMGKHQWSLSSYESLRKLLGHNSTGLEPCKLISPAFLRLSRGCSACPYNLSRNKVEVATGWAERPKFDF
jgi:hypothetical protein